VKISSSKLKGALRVPGLKKSLGRRTLGAIAIHEGSLKRPHSRFHIGLTEV